tara:strand:+ start:3210 stop:4277 length:1068 start_codon:yes stop_codon:yes gene_type:complete
VIYNFFAEFALLKTKSKILIFTFIICLSFVFLLFLGYYNIKTWLHTAPEQVKPGVVTLYQNQSLKDLAKNLESKKIIDSALFFEISVRAFHEYKNFQAGVYSISSPASPNKIIQMLSSGEIYNPVVFDFIIPEGFNLEKIKARLVSNGIDKRSLDQAFKNQEILDSYDIEGKNVEGFLYPARYQFFSNIPSATTIVKTMINKFFETLPENYLFNLSEKNLNLQQAVIIASLIEKETSLEVERPLIAETIFNRLNKSMPLGIDASLIYGIKNFDGDIKRKHIMDSTNLYNTRIHRGLPPGPICSPSLKSLEALLNPSQKGYLYYVLKPGKNEKNHHFSKSLKEHNKHVRKLIEFSR